MAILELDSLRVEYDRTGSGPDLLCLHSLLTELTVFDRVLPPLAATRRVTRFNLPGFGASTPTAFDSVADHAPPTLARALAEQIPGATYREIPGSGHCPMLEQPETLVQRLAEFLD